MELDDTVKATIEKLKTMGIYNDTLIVVTADHARESDVLQLPLFRMQADGATMV